jgi:type II secretory pathway pseudopilin PulG
MSVRHAHLRVGLWRRAPLRAAFSLLELVIALGVIITLAALFIGISRAVLQSAERRELDAVFTQLYAALDAWQQANGREMSFQRRVDPLDGALVPTLDAAGSATNPQMGGLCYEGMPSADIFEEHPSVFPPNSSLRYIIVVFVDRLAQVEESRELLSRIRPDYLRTVLRNPQNGVVLDGLPNNWGQPVGSNPNGLPRANDLTSVLKEVVDPWGNRLGVVFPGRPLCRGELFACQGIQDTSTQQVDPRTIDCTDGSVRTRDERELGSCRNRRPYFVSSGPDGRFGNGDDIFSYEPLRP